MKKLKYLLFILPFLFGFNVFAKEVDVTSNCYGTTGYSGMYSGYEVQFQTDSNYNFGTTYQYQLSSFETELRYSLSANTDYVITFNTNGNNDFRNNFKTYNVYDLNNNYNNLVTSFTFVSMKKVQISFRTTTATNKIQIQMGGSNVNDNITGEVNWNIKNAILTIPDTAPSGSTNQDIINNQTNNTNNIINNQNENTSNIINNANENAQAIIDSNKENFQTCRDSVNLFNKSSVRTGSSFGADGSIETNSYTSNNFVQEIYIPVDSNTSYTFSVEGSTNASRLVIMEYTGAYTFIKRNISLNTNSYTITTGSNVKFVRLCSDTSLLNKLQFQKGNKSSYEEYGKEICTNKIDDTTNAINDVNNSINNPNVDNNTGSGFFNDFSSQDFGLSQIITIPLNTIQGLTSKSCVPLQVPIPFTNSNITLPCMTEIYETKFSTIYNLWKIVSFGIVAYLIAIDIFHIVKGFKDPESDKVEVLDL